MGMNLLTIGIILISKSQSHFRMMTFDGWIHDKIYCYEWSFSSDIYIYTFIDEIPYLAIRMLMWSRNFTVAWLGEIVLIELITLKVTILFTTNYIIIKVPNTN